MLMRFFKKSEAQTQRKPSQQQPTTRTRSWTQFLRTAFPLPDANPPTPAPAQANANANAKNANAKNANAKNANAKNANAVTNVNARNARNVNVKSPAQKEKGSQVKPTEVQQQQVQARAATKAQAQAQVRIPQVQAVHAKQSSQAQIKAQAQTQSKKQTQAQVKPEPEKQAQVQVKKEKSEKSEPEAPAQEDVKSDSMFASVIKRLRGRGSNLPVRNNIAVQILSLGDITKLLKDPLVKSATLNYHHPVPMMDENGQEHKRATVSMTPPQIAAYVERTFENSEANRVISGILHRDTFSAAADSANLETLTDRDAVAMSWSKVMELTTVSPIVKNIVVERALDTIVITLHSKTDGTLADMGSLSPLQTYAMLKTVIGMLSALHAKSYVYGGVDANSISYSAGGLGGVRFAMSIAAHERTFAKRLTPLTVEEMKTHLSTSDRQFLKKQAPTMDLTSHRSSVNRSNSDSGSNKHPKHFHPAQLDLITLAAMLYRILEASRPRSSKKNSSPNAAPSQTSQKQETSQASQDQEDVFTLVRAIAKDCVDPSADYSTARYKLAAHLGQFKPKYDHASKSWSVKDSRRDAAAENNNGNDGADAPPQMSTKNAVKTAISIATSLASRRSGAAAATSSGRQRNATGSRRASLSLPKPPA